MKWSFLFLVSGCVFFFLGIYLLSLDFLWVFSFVFLDIFGLELEYVILFDWVSCLFFSFVMFITFSVILYSEDYMHGDMTIKRFYYLVIFFVASMGLMIFSPNLISIMLGWDGLGIISYCLVIYYGGIRAYGSGMITFLTNRVGDILLIFGMINMTMCGGWGFIFLGQSGSGLVLLFFVFFGALTKSAQFPFSSWLPAAMAAPTPVSSLVHSSTLVTAGVYLLIRFTDFIVMMKLSWIFGVFSLVTMVVSGVCALSEMDLSSVIAFSTLSQLGIMMFILYLGDWVICYTHMVIHAFFSALMFLSGGVIIHGLNVQDFRFMGSVFFMSPVLGLGFLVSGISLGGAPFMSGFYSKDLCIEYMMYGGSNLFMELMMFVCCLITVIYMYLFISGSLSGLYMGVSLHNYGESFYLKTGVVILSLFGGFSGSFLTWALFLNDFYFDVMSEDKWFILGLFPIGLLLGLFFGGYSVFNLHYFGDYIFYMFNSSYLSGDYLLSYFNFSSSFVSYESGWSEVFGALGVYSNFVMYGKVFFYYSFIFFSYIMVFIFYIFMF